MTLIIKELIIRGVLTSDSCNTGELSVKIDTVQKAVEEMKKEIRADCLEMITRKLEVKNVR